MNNIKSQRAVERGDRIVIFLTGCINPGDMSHTVIVDSEYRKNEYLKSIRFYLDNSNAQVLFVENSGCDISKYFVSDISRGRLEVITFLGNSFDRNLGKGYGEMLIVKYACSHSLFFKDADFIFKVTGRYKVLNITSFIKYRNRHRQIDVIADFVRSLSYVDSRFWGATPSFFYEFLLSNSEKVDDGRGVFFEHVLSKSIHMAIQNDYIFRPFKSFPEYVGRSGSEGYVVSSSLLRLLYRNIKCRIKYILMTR
ncbi:hypothetical protein [Arcticibacter tournemirensis]